MTPCNATLKRPLLALHSACNTETFRERSKAMFACTPLVTAKNRDKFEVNAWHSENGIFFLQNEADAIALKHGRRHISHTGHCLILRRMVTGNLWGRVGEDSTMFVPGPIYVQDQELAYEGIQEPSIYQNAFIVKSAIGFDPNRHIRAGEINPSTLAGQCLTRVWEQVFAQLWANDTYLDLDLYDRFLACVKVALGAPAEREDVRIHARKALFDVICRFIEHNLGDFDLSVGRLLHQFGVSRATLFRMFETQGGVRHYIRQRRATRALLDVACQPYQRGAISAAAQEWGFSSAPNFNRIIRDLYGISPAAMFDMPECHLSGPLKTHLTSFMRQSSPMRGASF